MGQARAEAGSAVVVAALILVGLALLAAIVAYDWFVNKPKNEEELNRLDISIGFGSLPEGSTVAPVRVAFSGELPPAEKLEFTVKVGAFRERPSLDDPKALEKVIDAIADPELKVVRPFSVPLNREKWPVTATVHFDCRKAFTTHGSGFWLAAVVKVEYRNHSWLFTSERYECGARQYVLAAA